MRHLPCVLQRNTMLGTTEFKAIMSTHLQLQSGQQSAQADMLHPYKAFAKACKALVLCRD